MEYGIGFAFGCTLNDPSNLAGILAWGKMIRSLRDQLIPLGWRNANANNYPTVIHPTLGYAISVAAGDVCTGTRETPTTRAEKGYATRLAVARNQHTLAEVDPSFAPFVAYHRGKTWLLLHYADEKAEETRCELSLPAEIDDHDYVVSWHERLILSPLPFVPSPVPVDEPDEEEEIDVTRRVS